MPCRKIVIIGPESTGKSSLCEGLAAHFQTEWVPEYAREYLLEHGMDYRYEDLITIAKGQLALEEAGVSAVIARSHMQAASGEGLARGPLLFIDTDMYVMKVWGEFVFGRCETWVLDQIVRRRYDGYLLCKTDLPWAPDPLREYPDLESREQLFHIYKDLLVNQQTPWVAIGGQQEERLEAAIAAVNGMLEHG